MTSKGLKSLAKLPKLDSLEINFTSLRDTDLELLSALTGLKTLNIKATEVTPTGVEKLHKALPRCQIISEHGTIEPAN